MRKATLRLATGAGLLFATALLGGCGLDDQGLFSRGYIPPSPPPPAVQVAAVPVAPTPDSSGSPTTLEFRADKTLLPGYKADADKKNPIPSDDASIKRGKDTYDSNCAICHGDKGQGDGANAPLLPLRPRNLTQGVFQYGSSDGEIFRTIQEGVPPGPMLPWKSLIEEKDTWDLVNYIKSMHSGGVAR